MDMIWKATTSLYLRSVFFTKGKTAGEERPPGVENTKKSSEINFLLDR